MRKSAQKLLALFMHLIPVALANKLIVYDRRFVGYLRSGKIYSTFSYLGAYRVSGDPSNAIEKGILSDSYEPHIVRLISSSVKQGDVCVDVGANVGAIALALHKASVPEGKVYAFEPGLPTFLRLQRNVEMNASSIQDDEIEPLHMALSDKEGELFWQADETNAGNGGFLTEKGVSFNKTGDAVPVTTLDLFSQNENLQRLDFMKIDVEGMEIEVLRGGRETIRWFRPKILLETLKDFSEIRGRDLLGEIKEFFDEMGYELYRVGDNMPIKSVSDFGMNTLALPRNVKEREKIFETTDGHR